MDLAQAYVKAFACFGMVLLAPGVLLLIGWWDLRGRRYERATSLVRLAGVATWFLLGIEGLAVTAFLFEGRTQWREPVVMAVVVWPPLLWFLARTLHASIRRHREEDRLAFNARRAEERERKQERKRKDGGDR